ncbi:MAG: uracil-DNA glycosylase [Rhodoluna sp.]|nr:uracil-DNA glycosylase [Rhodoluna sp.]
MFFEQMHPTWQLALADARDQLLLLEMKLISGQDYAPIDQRVMRAFQNSMDDVKVLLVGQDPYPTSGHAIGLSFAVEVGTEPLPRSLQNILTELKADLGQTVSADGDLSRWVPEGVMLLNRHLTVPIGKAGGHSDLGWGAFTEKAVAALANRLGEKLVVILWGKEAQALESLLGSAQIIKSAHPSPLSARRGFFGSKPFSKANDALRKVGRLPIDWSC